MITDRLHDFRPPRLSQDAGGDIMGLGPDATYTPGLPEGSTYAPTTPAASAASGPTWGNVLLGTVAALPATISSLVPLLATIEGKPIPAGYQPYGTAAAKPSAGGTFGALTGGNTMIIVGAVALLAVAGYAVMQGKGAARRRR